MLLPDDIHPELSIYYNGAFVYETIREVGKTNIMTLFFKTQELRQMTMPIFVLCLDWLFLLGVITLNKESEIELCS